MTVLVVGATGTVGREVVTLLAADGVEVRAGSRRPRPDVPAGVEAVRLDLEDPATWPAALAGVDRMFFLRPPDVARVARLVPFLDAAVAAGVSHVVLLSVQGAGRNPLLPHRALERRIERTPLVWTFLRPGYFMQNLLTVHRPEIRDRSELFLPAGDGRTAFIDVRDVAAVAVRALTGPGYERVAHDLTGSEAPTYGEVAAALSAAVGRPIRYARPGAWRYLRTELRRGRHPGLVAVTLVLYTAARLGLAGRLTDDVRRLLDRPPITLRQFTEDHADAWRVTSG